MPEKAKTKTVVERRIPKQKRSKEKVERILDSAAQLMTELGPENISTHQVAARAQIAVGSLYQFFPNIETVKIALVERVMNKLYETTIEVLNSAPVADIAEISELIIDSTLEFYHQRQDVVETILISRNSEAFQNVNERLNERLIDVIVNFVSNHHKDKDFAAVERKVRVSIMIGDVMTMLVWTAKDDAERAAYAAEWKVLTRNYAMDYLESK